ncbi:UDP-N-acetylglucosamine transferase subunit ALG14-like [Branchiostoma lanceolatum]|uniref:UDP-N-acetylglucosamine transferase subunit ALG14-like n=1 Tax=Branchiostoma lanceolatum TaxID=7740 RepID=UPI003454EC80
MAAVGVLAVGCVVLLAVIALLRLFFVFRGLGKDRKPLGRSNGSIRTLVVVGSGGHTAEILRLMRGLSDTYAPRYYIIAETDQLSEEKVHRFEREKYPGKKDMASVLFLSLPRGPSPLTLHMRSSNPELAYMGVPHDGDDVIYPLQYEVQKVPRSREMAQSWLSSVFTTLYATLYSIPLVFRTSPDLILCNGPGTCVPPFAAGFLMKFLGLTKVSLVYVEMFCRVETLSLSAQLLYYLADHFLVQWPQLHQRFPRTTYIGRVI